MRSVLLFIIFFITIAGAYAQRIRVNGSVTTKSEMPIQGVVVMAYDNSKLLRTCVTDEKGQYSFNIDLKVFDVLFYKPSWQAHTYRLSNRLDQETQGLYLDVRMDDPKAETAIDMNVWLKEHTLTAAYIDSIYADEIHKKETQPASRRSQRQAAKAAMAEQHRFANFREKTVEKSINNQQSQVTTVRVGPDTYQRIVNEASGAKKYFKNRKPIAEATYQFETTRRYTNVQKSSKSVKHFDSYKPQEHVKE